MNKQQRHHTEHHLLLRVTFLVPPLENVLYIVLLFLLDSQRDYLLSPVFFLLVFCTLETYLLARFLGMCIYQKVAIWNPLLGPLLLWLTPTSWNDTIVKVIIMETAIVLLLLVNRSILRIRKGQPVLCTPEEAEKANNAHSVPLPSPDE